MASKRLFRWRKYLIQHFTTMSNAELAERIGVSDSTIRRWASILGLKRPRKRKHKQRRYERFDDPRYQIWRLAVLEREHFRCQRCGKPARNKEHGWGLDCHHILSWAKHPEARFDVDNGMALCRTCHQLRHKMEGWL